MYQQILTGTILLICSATDIKKQKVYKTVAAGYFVLAFLGRVAEHAAVAEMAVDTIPGVLCLIISWISRQSLGYGDSVLVTGCGLSLGLWPCVTILTGAFFLSGLWAAGLLMFRRASGKKEISFVPFLFAGMVICRLGFIIGQ